MAGILNNTGESIHIKPDPPQLPPHPAPVSCLMFCRTDQLLRALSPWATNASATAIRCNASGLRFSVMIRPTARRVADRWREQRRQHTGDTDGDGFAGRVGDTILRLPLAIARDPERRSRWRRLHQLAGIPGGHESDRSCEQLEDRLVAAQLVRRAFSHCRWQARRTASFTATIWAAEHG